MLRVIFSIISLSLFACSSNGPYRTNMMPVSDASVSEDKLHNSIIQTRNANTENQYELVFIEFNDQGALQDSLLANSALSYLKEKTEDPSITIIYTHGWKHDAGHDSGNVKSFRSLLERTAEQQAKLPKERRLKVNGIYLGWRGHSPLTPWLTPLSYHILSYWDRKASAHKVGFGATPIFLQIEKYARQNDKNRLITVGHSFGAAVTYTALAPILQERYISSRRSGNGIVEGFGDLTVLLNPAFEASLHMPLYELTQDNCSSYSEKQPVRLLTITSQSDLAGRWALPVAQHVDSFLTERSQSNKPFTACKGVNNKVEKQTYSESAAMTKSPGSLSASVTHCLTLHNDTFYVKDKNITVNNNPYVTIQDSGNIIPDHNDIWNDQVIDIVSSVFRNGIYNNDEITVIESDKFHRSDCPTIPKSKL